MTNEPFHTRSSDWDEALGLVQSLIAARWRVMDDARREAIDGDAAATKGEDARAEAMQGYERDLRRASAALSRAHPDLMAAEILPPPPFRTRNSVWPLLTMIWTLTIAMLGVLAWAMTKLV